MGPLCDVLLAVPSDDTPRIQEAHEFSYHVIAEEVERRMFGAENQTSAQARAGLNAMPPGPGVSARW